MTLDEAEVLLTENNISFERYEFKDETEYWQQITLSPNLKSESKNAILVLRLPSKNGKKNIDLQFIRTGNDFRFNDLLFGDFTFEMFDYDEEMLANDLLDRINEIQSGNLVVIIAYDLKKRKWFSDAIFNRNEDVDELEKALQRIQKTKGIIARLLGSKKQYEIYDWNRYQCIIK